MTIFTKFWQNVTRNVINVKNIRAASLSCDKLREIHLIWVDTSRATLVHFKCYLFCLDVVVLAIFGRRTT